jgi:hypothetical protein
VFNGRGASVPRSHRPCRPQARRVKPTGFSFGFGGFGKLLSLLLRLALGCRWRSRPTKSSGPALLEPSLKVQGNAHNRTSGFAVLPLCDDLNAYRIRKVPRGISGGRPYDGTERPASPRRASRTYQRPSQTRKVLSRARGFFGPPRSVPGGPVVEEV